MSKKITWLDIYQDFKQRFPNLSKKAIDYHANGYMSILVYFTDGSQMIYDYMERKGKLIIA